MMISRIFTRTVAAVVLSAAASASPALAQSGSGRPGLYVYHTAPVVGGCPGLDWHITVGKDNSLVGFVAWDQGKHIAKLAGTINKQRTFEMNAEEVGTDKKAVVTGTAGGTTINVQINGSGTACDGVNLAIPRFAGGMAGGGG
jgi:hypothetical protein